MGSTKRYTLFLILFLMLIAALGNSSIGWIVWPVTVTVMTAAGFVVWVSVEL